MAAAVECGDEGYSNLGDVRIRLDRAVVGDKGGAFCLCFWLYLSSSARPSSVILRQVALEDQIETPFLALSEENKLILFPLSWLHKDAPAPASSFPWTDTPHASAKNECPLDKWVHVGCEVTRNFMRLHIDGKLVSEIHLSSLSNEQHHQDDPHPISLVGSDGKLEGYVYDIQVSPVPETIKHQYVKNPPVKLLVDNSLLSDGIEEGSDGVWSIVGGKASCRRNFSLEVLLLDAFGQPVNKEMEVLASLIYADNGAVVEKTREGAEAPLLISCEGFMYPSTSKPLPILRGRAIFKLKISQLSSKSDNRLFRVSFHTLHARRYPFLEASSKPIRCISRNRNSRPMGFGRRVMSMTLDEIHPPNNGQGFMRDCNGNGHLQSYHQSSLEYSQPSKCDKVEGDGSAMEIDVSGVSRQDGRAANNAVGITPQNVEGTDSAPSDSESTDAKSSENGSQRDETEPFSDATIFRYCLEGTYERSMFLRGVGASVSEEDLARFAEQVSLYSGCSHHRYQILMSKQLIQEGADTWTTVSKNKVRVLWRSAVPEIVRKFMSIAHSANRGLWGQDLVVLREVAGCGDDFGREEFDKLWHWLYPVAFSLSKDKLNNLWGCTSPKWIEGLVSREEAEKALKKEGSGELQEPGTFVLRFPTSRCWPHPDAGSLVVTYVGCDKTIHHKLLSLDYSDSRERSLQELLLEEPELSQLARISRPVTPFWM